MYVAIVPNRSSRPAILLRESYRDGDSVKNRTLANLSHWPAEQIETLRAALRGDKLVPAGEGMEIVRALPHGLGEVNAKEVYAALDWLGMALPSIENALALRHLCCGTLVLYEASSSY